MRSPARQPSPPPSASASNPSGGAQDVPATSSIPPSPARSDKSSDSEGKPVRDKLKETTLNAQTSSDPAKPTDQPMHNAPNGTDLSVSGSESDRGRQTLLRKRSRSELGEREDHDKNQPDRHRRKKSRDVTSPGPSLPGGATTNSVLPAAEHHSAQSASNGTATPDATESDKEGAGVVSPKNKRTHEQAKSSEGGGLDGTASDPKDTDAAGGREDERQPKRPRDLGEPTDGKSKIPPGSGFANASASSPFASLSSTPSSSSVPNKTPQDLPQTSDEKFKASGFGSFASAAASPFGGVAGSSKSPFGAASSGSKLTSFASSTNTSSPAPSGFGSLGSSSNKSGFASGSSSTLGGSGFGGSLGQSAFSGLGATKAGLSSFASAGSSTITGLSQKPARPFGSAEEPVSEEEEDDEDDDKEAQEEAGLEKPKSNDQAKRINLVPLDSIETGEEGEEPAWTGRAKLYTFQDGWQERGVGPFKFNITKSTPKKARFVHRADGTHRLLLNAAVTKAMKFGDAQGEKPKDGKILFNSPAADGKIVLHLLKMKPEKGEELYDKVDEVKDFYL